MTAINVPGVCVWEPGCSLAFSWQPAVIALVPARLPRNWHLGNENARCWRGHLIVPGLSEWEGESEWEGPRWGKGEQGMQRQRTGPWENRRELLASRHHLRTGLTHLLASFTSEEFTEGVGGSRKCEERGLKHGVWSRLQPQGLWRGKDNLHCERAAFENLRLSVPPNRN